MVDFQHLSLEQVELYYRQGRITESELAEYLKAWNATPGRFTYAYWRDGAIRQASYRDDGTLPSYVPVAD